MAEQGVQFRTDGPARIGVARIMPEVGGTYAPDPTGQPAWLFAEGFADEDGWHVVHDIVAALVSNPSSVWRRKGVEPILGRYGIPPARCDRIPLQAHANPLDWYLSGCSGFVVIDWTADLMPYLGVSQIYTEDASVAARIRHKTIQETSRQAPIVRVGAGDMKRAA